MINCRACSDVPRTQGLWKAFLDDVGGFCESHARSIYTLSKQLLAFKKDMVVNPLGVEPAGWDPVVERIVKAWDEQGANGTGAYTSVTQALTQLPRAWPYTRAAVARRPGMTARFTITGKNGEAEGVVVESMVW